MSGIKTRLLDNKKLFNGKATVEERQEAIQWAEITHKSLHEYAYKSGIQLPIAVLNAVEDRMIELNQAISKLRNTFI